MIDNDMLKNIMRDQAWERAKGELKAMLRTFYGETEVWGSLRAKVDAFVKDVENNELG